MSENRISMKYVYFGTPNQYSNPATVQYNTLLKNMAEYKKAQTCQGTGSYWLLLDTANNKAVKKIVDVGKTLGYDLIVDSVIKDQLKEHPNCPDITNSLL